MHAKTRAVLLLAIIMRDGDICLLCHEAPVIDKTIDHVNNNKHDNSLTNLVLLCRTCNGAEGNRARSKPPCRLLTPETLSFYRAALPPNIARATQGASVDVTAQVQAWAREQGQAWPLPTLERRGFGPVEEAPALPMASEYRAWLFRLVGTQGFITKNEAVNGGAEYLMTKLGRGNPVTTERYFMMAVSPQGWLCEDRDHSGGPIWIFRRGVKLQDLKRMFEARVQVHSHSAMAGAA